MKKWYFTASRDAIDIHYDTIIESETEPEFWNLYELAALHGCDYFMLTEV